jgi:hypothetical protein
MKNIIGNNHENFSTRKLPRSSDSDSDTEDEEWTEDDDPPFEEMHFKKRHGEEDDGDADYVPDLGNSTRSGRKRKRPSFFQVIKCFDINSKDQDL